MCFPGLAQAEEATGPVYESEVPTVPSKESSPPAHHKHSGGSKGGSEEGEASGSGAPNSGGKNGGSNGGGTNAGQPSQGPKGEGGQNSGGSGHAGVQKAKPINTLGEPAGHTEESSSSPLVPILIAIAVLAAISIGAFFYRQRRQDPDSPESPASPKAS
jgi:hypothetical protein